MNGSLHQGTIDFHKQESGGRKEMFLTLFSSPPDPEGE